MKADTIQSKPHYEILDGLRGVAAIMVLGIHTLEAYAIPEYGDANKYHQLLNHAYLAVDFFFVLSGFVIGYAYDDRWGKMTFRDFMKRRIFRLHPMVVFGTLLGLVLFYFGASKEYPLISSVPLWKVLMYAVLGILMIPTTPSMDIRGWKETYTLDAPAWTLMFEYIANILYALFIRRFTKTALAVLVILSAGATLHLTLTQGDVIGGWTLDAHHLHVGFTRLAYPFLAGLLLYRMNRLIRIRNAFLWCSLALVVLLAWPRVGGPGTDWMNGIYEAATILVLFPLIVVVGAGGTVKGKRTSRFCKLLGDISYPVYLVNYPICYLHTAWISNTHHKMQEVPWAPLLVFTSVLILAWIATKYVDIPIRKWLRRRLSST